MSTEHIKDKTRKVSYKSMKLVFLGETTGTIRKIVHNGTSPFIYTHMTKIEMISDPIIRSNGFVTKGNDWDSTKILGSELVSKLDPLTLKPIIVTKVYGISPWVLYNPREGSGLADLIPPELVFNKNDKYADFFLQDAGYIMGMPYNIDKYSNITPIITPHTKEIRKIVEKLEVPDYLSKALDEKLLDNFFTPFGDLRPHTLACDIELDNSYKMAIDPLDARYPVSSIGFYATDFKVCLVLKDSVRRKDYAWTRPKDADIEYKQIEYNTEKELVTDALKIIYSRKEKIVVFFNGDGFDMPYLLTRANHLGCKGHERYIWAYWDNRRESLVKGIAGKFLVDLYPFFKNPSIKNYAFKGKYTRNSLNEVSNVLLGVGKFEHSGTEINQLNADELSFYNMIDCQRTYDLCFFKDQVVFNLFFMLMRVSGLTFESVHRRMISAVVKGLFDTTLFHSNIVQPSKESLAKRGSIASTSVIAGKSYEGAYVFDPEEKSDKHPEGLGSVGWWRNTDQDFSVVCVDFASLYPSEIKKRNLCFSTINCEHTGCMVNRVPKLPHHVCMERKGIVATVLGFIRDIRVMYFKEKAKTSPINAIVEQVLKVLINAGYGVLGYEGFNYYFAPLAESTTAYGQRDIKAVAEICNENGVKVLYGDTDSIFLYGATKKFLEYLFHWVETELDLEMGLDYKGQFMLIYKKKNYIIDNEGKMVIRGMTGKKSNTPEFVRNCFSEVIEIIRTKNDNISQMRTLIRDTVMRYVEKLNAYDVDVIKLRKTVKLGRDLYSYKGGQQHVKAGFALAKYIKEKTGDDTIPDNIIVQKDTYIDFVVKKDGSPIPIELAVELGAKVLNMNKYKTTLINSLNQILSPLGIPTKQFLFDPTAQSLDEWF